MQLLSDLDRWLKKREARLNAEKETVLKVEGDAHIYQALLHLKVLLSPLSMQIMVIISN